MLTGDQQLNNYFTSVLKLLSDEQLYFLKLFEEKGRVRYDRYHKHFKNVFPSVEGMKLFMSWHRNMYDDSIVDDSDEESENSEVSDVSEDRQEYIHNRNYWYDASEDKYVVYLRSKNKPLVLSGSYWRDIRSSYSNWTGKANSINEISRKFGITRNTLIELLKLMGVTHDSSPFTEEKVLNSSEEELMEELVRRKEEDVLLASKRKEYRNLQKDAEKYRVHELYAREISSLIHEKIASHEKVTIKRELACTELVNPPHILLISPTDFHWGKYAGDHTGDAYNRSVAKERLFDCTKRLLQRSLLRGKPEKIVVGLGGDGLHIDNMQKNTTRGTAQDVDGSPVELVNSYIDLCREYVLYLNEYCDVDVYVVNGNHDFYSSVFLRACMRACFIDHDSINVINDLSVRQTFLYGNSLITFVHGDCGSVKDYPIVIASENSEKFGKSKWRYIFTGHLHTERELPQFGDTVVHRMPSLAGTDDWHHRMGYKSRKSLVGYVVDKVEGLVSKEIVGVS